MASQNIIRTKVDSPFNLANLDDFFKSVPANAEITVATYQGGSQRDPYPVAYEFTATWVGRLNHEQQ